MWVRSSPDLWGSMMSAEQCVPVLLCLQTSSWHRAGVLQSEACMITCHKLQWSKNWGSPPLVHNILWSPSSCARRKSRLWRVQPFRHGMWVRTCKEVNTKRCNPRFWRRFACAIVTKSQVILVRPPWSCLHFAIRWVAECFFYSPHFVGLNLCVYLGLSGLFWWSLCIPCIWGFEIVGFFFVWILALLFSFGHDQPWAFGLGFLVI